MQAGFTRFDRERIAPLFAETIVCRGMIEAGLSGMGRAWTDNPAHPRSAMMAVGDFLLCAGVCGREAVHQLRAWLRENREWLVIAPQAWQEHIGPHEEHWRYAFDHAVQPKDEQLRDILRALPEGMSFQRIDGHWYDTCLREEWSRDFVSLFTREEYERIGLGVLLMREGSPVAGASSYAVYPGGIEVQVQTRDGMEGRGYATLAAARLILLAHARGMRATWEAHNVASARIANKLGYRCAGAYTAAIKKKMV